MYKKEVNRQPTNKVKLQSNSNQENKNVQIELSSQEPCIQLIHNMKNFFIYFFRFFYWGQSLQFLSFLTNQSKHFLAWGPDKLYFFNEGKIVHIGFKESKILLIFLKKFFSFLANKKALHQDKLIFYKNLHYSTNP